MHHITLVVTHRLALQQQHVDALSQRLDQVREQIARSADEGKPLIVALAASEARLADEQRVGHTRHDIEDVISKIKVVIQQKAVRDQQQQARETQLALQLQVQQATLKKLNDQLEELERSMQPAAAR